MSIHSKLIAHISRKKWWHVPPQDPRAYQLRGKFYASTYREAEFYGRPEDMPARVKLVNPLVGDEATIETTLFGRQVCEEEFRNRNDQSIIEARLKLDARMKKRAEELGFDAILLMAPKGYEVYLRTSKIPRSLELNVFTENRVNHTAILRMRRNHRVL